MKCDLCLQQAQYEIWRVNKEFIEKLSKQQNLRAGIVVNGLPIHIWVCDGCLMPDDEIFPPRAASDPQHIPTFDNVNHPAHYNKHPSGVECITIVEHMNFNVGSAMKYLWRAGLKNAELEDLQKARWYINREIIRLMEDKK